MIIWINKKIYTIVVCKVVGMLAIASINYVTDSENSISMKTIISILPWFQYYHNDEQSGKR